MTMPIEPMPGALVDDQAVLLRLLTWLSPSFPVGGFSYSHGIEYAIEAGLIRDGEGLRTWIDGAVRFGAGRTDAILLGCAWRAEAAGDDGRLAEILAWAEAFRGTAELALETCAQGRAFLAAVRAAWPHPRLDGLAALVAGQGRPVAYPVAVGVACAAAGIGEGAARLAGLHAFAATLVSAGVRLIPLGQSDGLRVLAALEEPVREVAAEAAGLDLSDLAAAAWMADWCSARHETQYTRLFRS
jgi:urease accessory protein